MKKHAWVFLLAGLVALAAGEVSGVLAQQEEMETFAAGRPAKVGPLTYEVSRAWWETFPVPGRTDNDFLGIELSVKNEGTTTVQIPPFDLVDSQSREHGVNYSKIVWPRMSLGPGESERGRLYFHVPRDLSYRLMVSGGYLSHKFAFLGIGTVANGR